MCLLMALDQDMYGRVRSQFTEALLGGDYTTAQKVFIARNNHFFDQPVVMEGMDDADVQGLLGKLAMAAPHIRPDVLVPGLGYGGRG